MLRSLLRLAAIVLATIAALLAGAVFYLAFGDLSRHKSRIEALVAQQTGRPFAIDGALELQVLPSIAVDAERVRLGNADWGSQPQMVEVGRLSVRIGLWSLLRGPIDVRSFEVSDLSVLLETGPEGQGNWVLGAAGVPEEAAQPPDSSAPALPPVIQNGKLANVRITYRERGKPDRVALIETFGIGTGSGGLLAISGKGSLNEFPSIVSGELGPLFSGRDIRMAVQAGVGDLRLEVNGGLGRFDPLDGADLTVKLGHPDIGAMLKKLQLPVIATGALVADARLADAGDLTRLDFAAKLGDITLKLGGTLRALGLPGSDLRIEGSVANMARLAAAFDVADLPAEPLEFGGRVASSRAEIKLDAVSARFAGAKARVDGAVRLARGQSVDLRFDLAAESLARLRVGLPQVPLSMSGTYASSRDKLEVKGLKGKIGESEFSARASMVGSRKKRVDIELASPRLDLTPLAAVSKSEPKPKEAGRKYVFDEEPLPIARLTAVDARLRFSAAEVKLGAEILRDVDSTLRLDGGRLTLEGRAKDSFGGTIGGALKLAPADSGSAVTLNISVSAKNVRSSLGAGDAIEPKDAPPTNVEASLLAKGGSARQMASRANGRVLVTQAPGKLPGGIVGLIGGDLLRELASKLNPFSAQDPYTQLECTVARAEIIDGQVAVAPVLLQSAKVTIVAAGKIDLGSEALRLNFNTRPRTGVGISAGMFANPFIELAGTLASPRLGVSAKGTTAAVATGGVSVLAQGMLDRVRGTQDLCKKTLEESAKAK
jgi:AsmA family protein